MNRTEPVADRIAREARARFPRWDARLWKEILDGPAAELARALDEDGGPADRSRPALEAYLALAAEAAGLGYLYPRAAGRDNAFSRAWFGWLPQGLAAEPPARRAELLAACWNLAENLERSAPWLQRIFLRRIPEDLSLDRLEDATARVSEELLAAPDAPLGP
ncbi:MAG: hypothetical protein MUC63_10430, partial [Planctomycetes bacterium]|nr:hypothetical protein [Planctomycetota bacterium]